MKVVVADSNFYVFYVVSYVATHKKFMLFYVVSYYAEGICMSAKVRVVIG